MKRYAPLLLAICAPLAHAHAVPTHHNITRAAVAYLSQFDARAACTSSLENLLQVGTGAEDDGTRPIFHFTPALSVASSTCSSIQWGFDAGACQHRAFGFATVLTNTHRWPDALAAAKDAAGNPSPDGLRELGYVLHLLEDLTSPAHTRNDAHPPGDGDPLEAITRTPVAPPMSAGLVPVSSAESLFSELQAYTSSHFYSKDTVFEGSGPVSARADRSYFYDADAFRIAYKGLRYWLSGTSDSKRDPTWATIDDTIATEQFAQLGPLAVRYSASLIAYYLDQAAPKVDACTIDFEKFSGPSVFTGVQPPLKVGGATISGGQILSGATYLPRDRTTVYGSAFFCPGCARTMTIDFDNPVDGVRMLLMNGQTFTVDYTVVDDTGGATTVSLVSNGASGAAVVNLPSKRVKQVRITSGTDQWDFLIDNLVFGGGVTPP